MYGNSPHEMALMESIEMDFLGKKARARREERRATKQKNKLEKIGAKAAGRTQVAKAGGGLAGFGKNLVSFGKTMLSGGDAQLEEATIDGGGLRAEFETKSESEAKDAATNYTPYIIGGVVLVVVVVVVWMQMKKKPGKA